MTHDYRVYIASPYTLGDVAANVSSSIEMWHKLADKGYAPFSPLLSHYLHLHRQRPYTEWLEHDMIWLRQCDAVLRMPGESKGADAEVAEAIARDIPVVYTLEELEAVFNVQYARGGY